MSILAWLKQRKTAASITALAVIVATPVTFAVLHEGFPISDVKLDARDVWVTNSNKTMTGRLNTQISELNGAVAMASTLFDVMQDGDDIFVYDQALATVERVDPAYTSLGQRIDVPDDAQVTYGGSTITILQPSSGALWVVDAGGELAFDPAAVEPVIELGPGAQAVATLTGVVFAVSPEQGRLFRIEGVGALPVEKATLEVTDYELSTVGDRAVVLDYSANRIVKDDGGAIDLPDTVIRLQQPGPARDFVVAATGDALLKVSFGGSVEKIDADVATNAQTVAQVAAPVVLGTCVHGAWSNAARYIGACDGAEPAIVDIPGLGGDAELRFRVNHDVIALNNLADGDAWLVADNMTLVENWDEVTPPEPEEAPEGDEKAATQSFADTLADRTDQNRAPIARPDQVGVRPNTTTIIAALDNDTDPDGDVLTITNIGDVSEAAGVVQFIDDGRALQFVPAPGASGTVSFRYSISDGRPGGVAESTIDVKVSPDEENLPPVSIRTSQLAIEVKQTLTYNVLSDLVDPDGDDLILTSAVSTTGDIVRFRPDGEVTFTHSSSELGAKPVTFVASDGRESVTGEFIVDVQRAGELDPIGTPDFASSFAGRPVELSPLANDRSPSGEPLTLQLVEAIDEGISATFDPGRATITATGSLPGVYYLKYALAAGPAVSEGLVRVDVREDPEQPLPPVAVKDTAYLRPNEQTSLAVLANDQSPSGAVIGVQGIELTTEAKQLISVEVLNSTILRITSQAALTAPVSFSYTISDGTSTSTAGVTVVPVPELVKHQAPIAADDVIKVRAGDVASVSVLANDFHPDGARMILETELVEANAGDDGLAFITGDRVRLQAPSEPGQYSVTYRITDAFSEAATANVVFTVLADDPDNNQAPLARPLTARVFQGGSVTVDVPLDGVDPDGDSVVLESVGGTLLGDITARSSASFTYTAYEDKSGTDSFTYEVRDSFGAVATGIIEIGVIERGSTVLAPSAVNDEISIRPGRVASVPVLGNDSDPNGYAIALDGELLEVQEGISAETDLQTKAIIVTAGDEEGTFSLRYSMNNGHGGQDDAFLIVSVSKDAPLQPPVALDHVLEVEEIVGLETVEVNVLDGAQNPGGLVSELVVSTDGVNADAAEVGADGTLSVTLSDSRQAIAYRLTNETDDLSAMAFVIVPAYTSDLPPSLKPELVETPPVVGMNQTIEWKIADLLVVPSGRQVRITEETSVSAGRGNGDPLYVDEFTLRYTPEADFRGSTVINFEVTDGSSAADQSGARAQISMKVTVGDPNFEDVAPEFSNTTIQIEAGEAPTTLDLRQSSSHPNPSIVSQLSYSAATGSTSAISGSISGSTLTASAPFGTQPGETATLAFTVDYKSFSVPAEVTVEVVASTRPLAQPTDDVEPEGRPSSSYTISPLDNDFNPFATEGQPLAIVGAEFEGATLGATVTSTATSVRVSTSSTKSGTISIVYTVRDATDTAAREVQGRITVVVASAPEPVTEVDLSNPGSETVNVVFRYPGGGSNGAEITTWTVQVEDAFSTVTRTDCVYGATCQFTARTNGSRQTVTVAATNRVGTTWSSPSTITPYGTPSVPTGVDLSANSTTANATISPTWGAPDDAGGGGLTYNWSYTQGASGAGTTPGTSGDARVVGAGDYSFQVQACNPGGCSAFVGASRRIDPAPPVAYVDDGGIQSGSGQSAVHYLQLDYANIPPGSYLIRCYADGTNGGTTHYQEQTLTLSGSGSVRTACVGVAGPVGAEGWLMIEIVGVRYTPHYTPWT